MTLEGSQPTSRNLRVSRLRLTGGAFQGADESFELLKGVGALRKWFTSLESRRKLDISFAGKFVGRHLAQLMATRNLIR